MILKVERKVFNENDTIGNLYIDGVHFCYTLENIIRKVKVEDKTAIPAGTYKVELRFSPHFQKILPHLIDVPDFEDILMHPGNTELDTHGCILVAFHTDNHKIWEQAADELVKRLEKTIADKEDVTITVE